MLSRNGWCHSLFPEPKAKWFLVWMLSSKSAEANSRNMRAYITPSCLCKVHFIKWREGLIGIPAPSRHTTPMKLVLLICNLIMRLLQSPLLNYTLVIFSHLHPFPPSFPCFGCCQAEFFSLFPFRPAFQAMCAGKRASTCGPVAYFLPGRILPTLFCIFKVLLRYNAPATWNSK